MRYVEYVACMGKPKQKDHLEDPGIEGWVTLKLIFKNEDGRYGLNWSGSGQGHVAGLLQTWWTSGFDKMWRVCWLAKELLASQGVKQSVGQSVSWLLIIRYLVSFPCIYWKSLLLLVYPLAHNTHHAFLHNAKYFFKCLYFNSGTLTARSCRIFSKCNKVAYKHLTQLKTFDKCIWKKTYWSYTGD